MRFSGTFTALCTPFSPEEGKRIDFEAFDRLVQTQVSGGVTGLVPCGTTGESPALHAEEQLEVIKRTVARKGKTLVIAGTGSNSTEHTIELSRAAESAGVDAVMVVVPYYNKPTQAGLRAHFVTVARSVKCPVVIYNIPGRTGIDLMPDTVGAILSEAPNVLGMKEATGNVVRAQDLVRRFGSRLSVLSGDDAITLPMISVGAQGVISVASNVLPAEVTRATALALEGKMEEARRAHFALLPIFEALFIEANPGPVKAALAHRKIMHDVLRGPMASVSDATRKAVIAALESYQ